MKKLLLLLALVLNAIMSPQLAFSRGGGGKGGPVAVQGYYRSNGTYVAPHMRSAPDGDFGNNWSTSGNINPYTGKEGTLTAPNSYDGMSSKGSSPPSPIVAPQNSGLDDSGKEAIPLALPEKRQFISQPVTQPATYSSKRSPNGEMPANAQLDYNGHAWTCLRGYAQRGGQCEQVSLPPNAQLDYTGHAWTCSRGYAQRGEQCEQVSLPPNAQLDYTGHAWTCSRGYVQRGKQCEQASLPPNAQLDYTGHAWTCSRGFVQRGEQCGQVSLPPNAQLDYTGHAWTCSRGYRQEGNRCGPI